MRVFFDMAGRFKEERDKWYGRGFRLGDRAAGYVKVLHRRLVCPHDYITVFDDVTHPECSHTKEITAQWMLEGIADEIIMLNQEEPVEARPQEYRLHNDSLWVYWHNLRYYRPPNLVPKLRPDPLALLDATLNIPFKKGSYITIHPLVDAGYNTERNRDAKWWESLIALLAPRYQVVVLGPNVLKLPDNVFHYTTDSMMNSLAAISYSSLFIGGETGLTLWAPIFQIPTMGLYSADLLARAINQISYGYLMDTAPISFGSPVIVYSIEHTPEILNALVDRFVMGHIPKLLK